MRRVRKFIAFPAGNAHLRPIFIGRKHHGRLGQVMIEPGQHGILDHAAFREFPETRGRTARGANDLRDARHRLGANAEGDLGVVDRIW